VKSAVSFVLVQPRYHSDIKQLIPYELYVNIVLEVCLEHAGVFDLFGVTTAQLSLYVIELQ